MRNIQYEFGECACARHIDTVEKTEAEAEISLARRESYLCKFGWIVAALFHLVRRWVSAFRCIECLTLRSAYNEYYLSPGIIRLAMILKDKNADTATRNTLKFLLGNFVHESTALWCCVGPS